MPLWAVPIVAGSSFALTNVIANGIKDLVNYVRDPSDVAGQYQQIFGLVRNKSYMEGLSLEGRMETWGKYLGLAKLAGAEPIAYPCNESDNLANPLNESGGGGSGGFTPWQQYQMERDYLRDERDWVYKDWLMNRNRGLYQPSSGRYDSDWSYYDSYYDDEGGDYEEPFYGEVESSSEDGGLNGYGEQQYLNGFLDFVPFNKKGRR